jgi:hypothetical protein
MICEVVMVMLLCAPTLSDAASASSPIAAATIAHHSVVQFETDRELPEPEPEPEPEPVERNVWDRLAECESGNWINGGASFETGSARWDWAKPGVGVPPWGTTIHHGGLQFYPGTWTAYKLDGYPQYAYDATREQQIAVGERVLAAQGWQAWPTCSSKLGLR